MAWGRAEATEYLIEQHGDLITDAGIRAADEPGGLKEPIDAALLAMGALPTELDSTVVADVARFRDALRSTLTTRVEGG